VNSGASYHLTDDFSILVDPEPADLELSAMGNRKVKAEWVGKASLRYEFAVSGIVLFFHRYFTGEISTTTFCRLWHWHEKLGSILY
jgi:hypothetical protein